MQDNNRQLELRHDGTEEKVLEKTYEAVTGHRHLQYWQDEQDEYKVCKGYLMHYHHMY